MTREHATAARFATSPPQAAPQAAELLRRRSKLRPSLAVVLGSGFQNVLTRCTTVFELPYAAIPGFPRVSVPGHEGKLALAYLAKIPVLFLSGRAHYYEGHSMDTVTFSIRMLAGFGVRSVLLTSASGGINRRFRPKDFMYLTDHINWMGLNPLRGLVEGELPRFLDLTDTYDPQLNNLLRKAANKCKLRLHGGVYLAVSGPTYETPAEIRAFQRLGADAVGMSTVPEAIVAKQHGLRVAGLSCITNLAAGLAKERLSHAEVLATGEAAAAGATRLLETFVQLYAETR